MEQQKQGWSAYLMLICIAVTVGSVLPVGYCFSVVNTPAEFVKNWSKEALETRYGLELSENGLAIVMACFVSFLLVGGMIGSLFGGSVSDKYGRKFTLIIAGLLFSFGAICQFGCRIANFVEILLLGRFLCGIASAFVYTAQPTYLVEIAPLELSGSVGVCTCIGITFGIVVGQLFSLQYLFGTEHYWNTALSFYIIFILIGYFPFFWFPESPRWLLSAKKDMEKAKLALVQLRGSEEAALTELSTMDAGAKDESASVTIVSVFSDPKLKLPLILVCVFHMCQQLSGINAIFYYSMSIFTKAGFSEEVSAWLNFGCGILNFFVAMLGPWLMVTFNRRFLMMLSMLGSTVFQLSLSFGLKCIDVHASIPLACTACLGLFITFFNLGLGTIPFFIGSELFEVAPRSVAMALGSFCNWFSNFTIGMYFPILNQAVGSFVFLPCAMVCILGFLFTCRYLPETRNRDISEITPLVANGFKSKIS